MYYIASDNRVFSDKDECIKYEKKLKLREEEENKRKDLYKRVLKAKSTYEALSREYSQKYLDNISGISYNAVDIFDSVFRDRFGV